MITIILFSVFAIIYFYNEIKSQQRLHKKIIFELTNNIQSQNEKSKQFDSNFYYKTIEKLNSKLEIIKNQVDVLSLISNE